MISKITGVVLAILGVALVYMGGKLLFAGGSLFYALMGVGLLITAIMLFLQKRGRWHSTQY